MPVINITALVDRLGGTSVADGKIIAIASSANHPTPRYSEGDVVFPKKIQLNIVNGEPVDEFSLVSLPVGMYWSIGVYVNGYTALKRTVTVPAGNGPFDFGQLIDVDPDSALPDPNSTAADALVAELQTIVDSISGASGSFVAGNKTVTVVNGIITSIVTN